MFVPAALGPDEAVVLGVHLVQLVVRGGLGETRQRLHEPVRAVVGVVFVVHGELLSGGHVPVGHHALAGDGTEAGVVEEPLLAVGQERVVHLRRQKVRVSSPI